MNLKDSAVNSKTKNKAGTQVYLGYVDAEATCYIRASTDNRWLRAQKMSIKVRSSCRAGSQITAFPCPCSKIMQCCSLTESINEKRHCLGRAIQRKRDWVWEGRELPWSLCPQEVLHKGLGHKFTLFAVWETTSQELPSKIGTSRSKCNSSLEGWTFNPFWHPRDHNLRLYFTSSLTRLNGLGLPICLNHGWPHLAMVDHSRSPGRTQKQLNPKLKWIFLIPWFLEELLVTTVILQASCCLLRAPWFSSIHTQIHLQSMF